MAPTNPGRHRVVLSSTLHLCTSNCNCKEAEPGQRWYARNFAVLSSHHRRSSSLPTRLAIHHITSRPIPPSLTCERRGRGTKMLPGAGGAAGGGGALGHVRAAARANFFLSLALAAMALVVATSNHPSDLHVHTQIGHAAAPAAYAGETQQQQHCAATEAEALNLRKTALMLVLSGLAQAMIAAAADLALAWDGGFLGRLLAVVAPLVGAMNVYSICYVIHGVAVVAGGHCAAGYLYLPDLVSYVVIAVSYAALLVVSLAVTICG